MASGSAPRVLHDGTHLCLLERDGWEYAARRHSTGVVLIVAVNDDGKLILAEQVRKPLGARVIELPAGLVGDLPGGEEEDWQTAARRELLEETGYEAAQFTRLLAGPVSAGLTSEIITFVRAEGLRRIGPGGGDEFEDIVVHEVALEDVLTWLEDQVDRGFLIDPKILAALFFVQYGGKGAAKPPRPTP